MIDTDDREHPSDAFAARLASFSSRLAAIARRRAVLDAEEARLLAEAAAYADATTSAVLSSHLSESEGRDLARRSLCASLAMATRSSELTLQHRIGEAETLVQDAPTVLAALEGGTINAGHAKVIVEQLRDVPVTGRVTFLDHVLPVAERSTPARLKQRARVLRERFHPESITVRAKRSAAERRVTTEPAADGMAWLHLLTTAPIALAVMSRLDGAALSARASGDDRTLAQLRADALSSLAVAGTVETDGSPIPTDPSTSGEVVWLGDAGAPASWKTMPAPGTPLIERPVQVEAHIRPTVDLEVPALALLGLTDEPSTLDGYGPIDPDTAARLAVAAPSMTRVLTHPETGAVVSVGRGRYRVPADLKRAVQLRDVTCRAPGCGRRARDCGLDHTTAWQDGGTTSVGNLAALCRHHHRLKHLPGWHVEQRPGGVLRWTTPDGRQHDTRPAFAETG